MAQETALKEVAKSKLRRWFGYTKSPNCDDVRVRDPDLFCKAPNRRGALG